jgi:hypothetical protein
MKHTKLTRRARGAVALAVGLLLAFGGSVAGAAPAPLINPFVTTCSNAYFDNDNRLGPAQLATFGLPFAPILIGYDRLAGLTPAAFIATYWDPTANGGSGGWRFPPDNGFLLDSRGNPIEFVGTLTAGEAIDRFGSEFGAFLAPEYTPYAQRALPPMSLDNFDPSYTCNYHQYVVRKTFHAEEGPIAPGFGQLGRGIQFQLVSSLVPGSPTPLNVMWLINNGYLARAN